jgi:hypothetical protein
MMGVQLGLINSAAGMYGIQGGLVNVLAGDTIGLQMGLANYSGNLKGAQIGIANVNGFVHEGAQIGLINIARKTTGAQVGLVNITATDLKGAQVGLVNFAGNGRLSAGMWVSDTALVNIGLKMGGKYTYGITGFSARVRGNTNWTTPFAGLGGHFDFHPFWFEMDGVCHWLLENSFGTQSPLVDLLVKTRFVVGARLGNQFSFFAGPVVNYLVSEVRDDIALSKNLSFYKYSEGNINHQISLGFMAGLQFEPQWGKLNIRKK